MTHFKEVFNMLDMADDVRDAWAEFINKIIIEPNGWENLLVQTIDSENEEMYGFVILHSVLLTAQS